MLLAQTKRMLRDARVRRFATEFAGNWLGFRRFEEHNAVDRERFPSFTNELRRAMYEEPIRLFVDRRQPRSLGARPSVRRRDTSSIPSWPSTTACPFPTVEMTTGFASMTPIASAAAGCCRCRSS